MVYLYFIEANGIKYYKCDSFWTENSDTTYAKTYGSGEQLRLLESYGQGFNYLIHKYPLRFKMKVDKMNGGILGYCEFEEDITTDSKPLNTHYLLKFHINYKGEYHYTDYKQIDRNNKINEILK